MKLLRIFRVRLEKYIRKSFLSGLIFKNRPVILDDKYGMRFILYPYAHEPLEKLISRRYLVGEYNAINKILKIGDIVVDIGANIGTHSVYMNKKIGSTGKIYAFEPIVDTCWELKENLVLNRIENVKVINVAITNKSGVEKMHVFPKDFSAWNSFGKPDTDESKPIREESVHTITLDQFVSNEGIKKINFLKIDAEGSEKNILYGATNLLSDGLIDILSFEISKTPMKGMGVESKEIFDILKQYNYNTYRYDSNGGSFIGPIEDSTVEYENYYASKMDLTKL